MRLSTGAPRCVAVRGEIRNSRIVIELLLFVVIVFVFGAGVDAALDVRLGLRGADRDSCS